MPGKGKEVKQFCTGESKSPVTYALYETVVGKDMNDEINNINGAEFINIYLQLLLSLNYANLKCDFTHFDLHMGNVILRKLEKTGVFGIKYPTQTLGDIYMYTSMIPTIIDYGYAHIQYKKFDYGYIAVDTINSLQSYPLFDAYKFLMAAALLSASINNVEVFEVCEVIYKFFSEGNLVDDVQDQSEAFYSLPKREDLRTLSLEPLILYMTENLDTELQTEPLSDLPLLECTNMCLRLQDVKEEIGGEIE